MKCWPMSLILRACTFVVLALASTLLFAQLPASLTVQEALYPGAPTKGINRVQDPVTVGIPLADTAGIKNVTQLGLRGASVGQFRVLGRWPSGNIQWILVDTQADLKGGGLNTALTLNAHGTGNFGGSDLATDNGSTITVNTGAAIFTVRKANFNVLDQVVVSGKTLIAPGTSQGLAVVGPLSPETSCNPGPCTTLYLSSNDSQSTATIEENGPVRAVIRADGMHRDSGGHGYLHFTVRLHFYKNKTFVKATPILRNADEGESNTFNSAAKGFASYEMRLTPAIQSAKHYAFGTDTGTVSGSFSGTENAYLYQAYSNDMEQAHWNGDTCPYGSTIPRCVAPYIRRSGNAPPFTYAQDGFQIVKGSTVLANADHNHYPAGWADLTDSTGSGIEVGVYQLAATWPKSLQFQSGGKEIRIGVWPDQTLSPINSAAGIPYYQAWPQYSIHDLYINFHSTTPLSLPNEEFLKFQHYLLARAPIAQYNDANVFFYALSDPVEEDSYWTSLSSTYGFKWFGNSSAVSDKTPKMFRLYAWRSPGGSNQSELRWGYLEQWLTRGLTGRYLTAAHFYRYQSEQAFPRSDMNASGSSAFDWRTHSVSADLDGYGFPANIRSANSAYVNRTWIDQEHGHWYGMGDYYFMTGDETVKDQMMDGVADRFLNTKSILGTGHTWNTRAAGAQLMGLARYRRFLNAIGHTTDIPSLDAVADATLSVSVFPELCVSGYPAGCNPTSAPSRGVSRTRGIADGGNDVGSDNNCAVGKGVNIRCAKPWMMAIQEEGMWEIAHSRGPNWPNNRTGMANPYQLTLDLAYGMANWTSNEDFVMGTNYANSGLKYDLAMDYPNLMTSPTPSTDYLEQFEFNYFLLGAYNGTLTAAQRKQFELTYLHMAEGTTFNATNIDDHDMYLTSAVLDGLLHPHSALVDVPIGVSRNGNGSYTLAWTAPAGFLGYRVKTAVQPIVSWIGFDPKTNKFLGDPSRTVNWFAATELMNGNQSACLVLPAAAGTHQSCTVAGLDAKQSWQFAMKATVTSGSANTLSVVLDSPESGSTVKGSVAVSAGISSTLAISGVQFLLDGAVLGTLVTKVPYSISWNSTQIADGSHTLAARVTDAAGNVATSVGVSVTVCNKCGNKPSVTITSPAANSAVSGMVSLAANATASAGIASVQFSIDGTLIPPPLTAPPYSLSWNTRGLSNGTHTVAAVVRDNSGQTASASETIYFHPSSACGAGWCNTFPVFGIISDHVKPPFGSSAWNKLNFVSDAGRFFIYTSDGIYTFSNSWWSYGVSGTMATANPWIEETTSGTVGATVTDNSKGFLNTAIGAADTTITLQPGQGATFHPDAVRGGVLVIDNEEIGYPAEGLSGDTFTRLIRGIRGTGVSGHAAGSRVGGGAPFPQSRIGGALVPVEDHIPDRHPFLFSSYNNRRSQLIQVTGIVENNKLNDTWYLCIKQGQFCSQPDVKVWRPLVTPTRVPYKADGAMTYDSDDDVMILYGGQTIGAPTADTWLLCFQADPQISGNNVGCPAGHAYPDWVNVTTNPSSGPGPRYFHSLVYDSYYHKAILFGGSDGATDPNSTWIYSPAAHSWTDANPSGKIPSAFRRPAMTYDLTRHVTILYEGPLGVVTDGIPGGLYSYDAGVNRWTLTSVPGGPTPTTETLNPPCHGRLSLAYDPQTDTFVATELGPGLYALYVWELPGTSIK